MPIIFDASTNFVVISNKYGFTTFNRFTGEKEYELCTNFLSSNLEKFNGERYFSDRWLHDKGEQCLKQKVFETGDKEFMPVPIR